MLKVLFVLIFFCRSKKFSEAVFDYMKCSAEWLVEEGEHVELDGKSKTVIARVKGPCRNILMAERTALNIMSRASGVATEVIIMNQY